MKIPINKELKIIFLKALKNGFINTDELQGKINLNLDNRNVDISPLTEKEKNQLFEISLKINKN